MKLSIGNIYFDTKSELLVLYLGKSTVKPYLRFQANDGYFYNCIKKPDYFIYVGKL